MFLSWNETAYRYWSDSARMSIFRAQSAQANDELQASHNRWHQEALHADAAVQGGCGAAADGKDQYVCRHLHEPRAGLAFSPLRRMDPVGQVDHDLRRRAGHQGGGGRACEVEAMESVLNRHGAHQNHSRQNGSRAVDVMERTESNRERSTGDQE